MGTVWSGDGVRSGEDVDDEDELVNEGVGEDEFAGRYFLQRPGRLLCFDKADGEGPL